MDSLLQQKRFQKIIFYKVEFEQQKKITQKKTQKTLERVQSLLVPLYKNSFHAMLFFNDKK